MQALGLCSMLLHGFLRSCMHAARRGLTQCVQLACEHERRVSEDTLSRALSGARAWMCCPCGKPTATLRLRDSLVQLKFCIRACRLVRRCWVGQERRSCVRDL